MEERRWSGITDSFDPGPYSIEIGARKNLILFCDRDFHETPTDAFVLTVSRSVDIIVGDSKKPDYELTIVDRHLGMKKWATLTFKGRPFQMGENDRLVNKHELGRGFVQPDTGRIAMVRPKSSNWRKRWDFECACGLEIRVKQERLVELIFKVFNSESSISKIDLLRLPLTILN